MPGHLRVNAIQMPSRATPAQFNGHHSGQQMEIPEIDRVEFFDLGTAKKKIKMGQEGLIGELAPF